jgi:hypothetical protein
MATIFRKLRLATIGAMVSKKYLAYALGEIILIVLGILIALEIDNWNNDRQMKKLEIKYLREMISNLKTDLSDVEFNIGFNIDKMKSNLAVAAYIRNRFPYNDSLNFHFSNLTGSTRFISNSSSFENFKTKGFEIIKNDSLRRSITELYSAYYTHIIGFEVIDDHRYQYEVLLPEVMENVKINEFWKSAEPVNHKALLNNVKFQNAIASNIFYRQYMISQYNEQREKVIALIKAIEEYLEVD